MPLAKFLNMSRILCGTPGSTNGSGDGKGSLNFEPFVISDERPLFYFLLYLCGMVERNIKPVAAEVTTEQISQIVLFDSSKYSELTGADPDTWFHLVMLSSVDKLNIKEFTKLIGAGHGKTSKRKLEILERLDLAIVIQSKEDTREKIVHITEKGKVLAQKILLDRIDSWTKANKSLTEK